MSRRRELSRQAGSLGDIGELLGAMKNLALAESRRIGGFIDAQRTVTAIVRDALAELCADFAPAAAVGARVDGAGIVCVIGSERGFCGDLNQRLAAAALAVPADARVLVGSRLADIWPEDAPAAAVLVGAGFADDVQRVLVELVGALAPLLAAARRAAAVPRLGLLYLGAQGTVSQTLLPAPPLPAGHVRRAYPLAISLDAAVLHAALLDQFIETALSGALYDALLYENQQRLEHMEHARRRIDERLAELGRSINRARQEEITEEIEVILLAALAAEGGADGGLGRP